MSALGQNATFAAQKIVSASTPKADIVLVFYAIYFSRKMSI